MAGLFPTAQEVRQAEAAARAQGFNRGGTAGLFGNLGHALGGALNRGVFGQDTRSSAEQQAAQIQQLTSGVDFSDSQSIISAANALNAAGFTPQAQQLLQSIQPSAKPHVVSEDFVTRKVGDTTGEFFVQTFSDGTRKKLFQLTDKGVKSNSGALIKFNPEAIKPVNFDQDSRGLAMAALADLPRFKSFFDTFSTDPEDLAPFAGKLLERANELKKKDRQILASAFGQGVVSGQDLAFETLDADPIYLRKAMQSMIQGGDFQALSEPAVGGDDPNFDPRLITDLTSSQRQALDAQRKREAKNQFERDLPQVANPRQTPKPFRLGDLDISQGQKLFRNIMSLPLEDVRNNLGAPMSDKQFAEHAPFWNYMKENPEFTASYLTLRRGQARNSLVERVKFAASGIGDWNTYFQVKLIDKYLRRLKNPPLPQADEFIDPLDTGA